MKNRYIKQWYTIVLGLFLMGAANAQTPPVSVKMGTNATDPVYYQHKYNKGGILDSPREDRDSVMIGSTMPYFVMPDATYNTAYATSTAGGDYSKINLTTSKFTWTVPASGSAAVFVNPNNKDGNTSPRVTIAWTAASAVPSVDTIRIIETPTEYNGVVLPTSSVCPGKESKIPVTVIPKSVIEFALNGSVREKYECTSLTIDASNPVTLQCPLTITTAVAGNKGIRVKYTLKKDNGTASSPIDVAVTDITKLPVEISDYGVYTVTITEITDPIARKCSITGTVTSAGSENVFTYAVLPQPKAGPTYHVPNNF